MAPPYKKGTISSNSSLFPYNTPMPIGANILCPEKARKSQPISFTSTGICGTDCAPSTRNRAPAWCASRPISCTGLIVPSMLDTWVQQTSRVRSVIASCNCSMSSVPSSWMSTTLSSTPFHLRAICQGTRFEWCSITVITISSPGRKRSRSLSPRDNEYATRLIASVQLRAKTISSRPLAPIKRATFRCASSYNSVASCPRRWGERWMLAL